MSGAEIEEQEDGADDLLEGIYDDTSPQHSVVERTDFKRWHHPRKHWVRIHQLCNLAQKLFSDTHFQDDTIRYLTLPGEELLDIQAVESVAKEGFEELLDVQSLHGTLERVKGTPLKIKYLGFNNVGGNKDRLAVQEHTESVLKDMDTIHQSSRILNGLVQTIANQKSEAYQYVEDNGPFNIINLDLCDSVAKKTPGAQENTYFNAIGEILDLQRKHMSQPFLMFIATRTEPQDINPTALAKIVEIYGENFKQSAEFKKKFEEMAATEAEGLLNKIKDGADVPQESLNRVFGVGLGKWLLHLMKPNPPHWDVSLEHICCYSIGDYEGNMLSLAFKFTQVNVGLADKLGLFSRLTGIGQAKTESELAMDMLERAKSITNVDAVLKDDPAQRTKIIEQAGRLLSNAGYSAEKYTEWANQFFVTDPKAATAAG